MIQVNPYARFDGRCSEAMTRYQEVFGGKLELQTVGESPMADQWPADVQPFILHGSLVGEGFTIYGSDMFTGDELLPGNAMAFSLSCENEEEANRLFAQLAEGGTVVRPLHRFFAGMIGVLIDRFGKEWMLFTT
jgi:PhnB protein